MPIHIIKPSMPIKPSIHPLPTYNSYTLTLTLTACSPPQMISSQTRTSCPLRKASRVGCCSSRSCGCASALPLVRPCPCQGLGLLSCLGVGVGVGRVGSMLLAPPTPSSPWSSAGPHRCCASRPCAYARKWCLRSRGRGHCPVPQWTLGSLQQVEVGAFFTRSEFCSGGSESGSGLW